jgi:hypothetical protein
LGKLSQTGREKEKKGHSPPYGDCDNSQKWDCVRIILSLDKMRPKNPWWMGTMSCKGVCFFAHGRIY